MSVLRFLRIIAETVDLAATNASRSPRRRKLALESLERRAMLTGDDPLLMEAANAFTEEATGDDPAITTESTTDDGSMTTSTEGPVDGGSGGGSGGEETSAAPVDGGSGSGTGGEETEPVGDGSGGGTGGEETEPVNDGSGSGTGEEVLPAVTSLYATQDSGWVAFFGTVTDDESLEGLTIYFTSDSGHQFTATIQADGSFSTASYLMEPGTQVTAWFIDADGNYSESAVLIV